MKRMQCSACSLTNQNDRKYCPECKGLGYIDISDCSRSFPECPLEGEAMTGGWICNKCGDSGPL